MSSANCVYHWGENSDLLGPLQIDYYYLLECSPGAITWLLILLLFLWVVMLMNLLAQTASDYFSPTLSKICENMHLAYDIAGVTLLALGNGAPDFFSLVASFSGGVDVLVGLGALLGGGMFVCTIVVGSIGILCPCQVSKTLFLRDIGFHLISVTCVAMVGIVGQITVGYAIGLLCLYLSYVCVVLLGSWCTPTADLTTADTDLILGDVGMQSLLTASPSMSVQTAFWHPTTTTSTSTGRTVRESLLSKGAVSSSSSSTSHSSTNTSSITTSTPYAFKILPQEEESAFARSPHVDHEDPTPTINMTGLVTPEFSHIIKEDYYNTPSEADLPDLEQSSSSNPDIARGFAQMQSRLRKYGDLINRNATKYQHVLSALYWQQYALTSQFRHTQIHRDWATLTWYHKGYLCLQYPIVMLRDVTIPDIDPSRWNKLFAVIHPVADLIFILAVSGQWSVGVGGLPSIVFCLLVGCPIALYVFLFGTMSRPPAHRFFVTGWSLLAFVMNVMWIYTLAGELIVCLSVLGLVLHIPAAFLGLTVLAWGNSVGDFFTNTAVAKQGLGAMALAGCYGGPVFNILVGLGSALLYASSQSYPAPYTVAFDTSSIVSLAFLCMALVSTMIMIPLRNYQLDQMFGVYLITLYAVYTMVQATIVIASS